MLGRQSLPPRHSPKSNVRFRGVDQTVWMAGMGAQPSELGGAECRLLGSLPGPAYALLWSRAEWRVCDGERGKLTFGQAATDGSSLGPKRHGSWQRHCNARRRNIHGRPPHRAVQLQERPLLGLPYPVLSWTLSEPALVTSWATIC